MFQQLFKNSLEGKMLLAGYEAKGETEKQIGEIVTQQFGKKLSKDDFNSIREEMKKKGIHDDINHEILTRIITEYVVKNLIEND